MKNTLRWCFKNITARFPGTVLALALLLFGLSIYVAWGLTFNPRMDSLLPQNLDMIQEFNEVVDKMGGAGPLVLVLQGLKPSQAPKVIDELAKRLENVPGVRFVDYRIPKEYLENRQLLLASRHDLLELESLIEQAVEYAQEKFGGFSLSSREPFNPEKLQSFANDYKIFDEINPYYKGKSQRNYFIFLQPQGTVTDTSFTEHFVKRVEEEIRNSGLEEKVEGLKIKMTGAIIVRLDDNRTIVKDLKNAALLAAILATSIILVYTRSLFSIPLIVVPLLLSLTYTFALTRLVVGHVNIISGYLVSILMGLGVDYGIHLYIRFKQELLKGKSIPEAVELVITQVGRSGMVCMFTTIGVFSLLILSDFRGFSEFGLIAVMGIICAFLTYFFLFPAQVLFYDRIHWIRKPRARLFSLKISHLYSSTPYFLSILFMVLLVISLVQLPDVEFEHQFQKLRGHSPVIDFETETMNDFGFTFSPTFILTPKKDNLFHIHQALEEIKRQYGRRSTIGMYQSLNLFSEQEYESKKDILARIKFIWEEDEDIIKLSLGELKFQKLAKLLQTGPFDESKIPPNLVKKFTAKNDYLVLILSPSDKNFFDFRNIYQLDREMETMKTILAEKQVKTAVLNENLLAAEILDWVKKKGPKTFAIAMGIVFLILLIDLRSLRLASKTFLPLVTGLALTGALMSIFHIKLNFINFVMLPSIVGIMIDHCIYLAHHILDYSRMEAFKSVRETGSAVILSALTTLAGYASLNVASHMGIRSIAMVVELGIITCTLCALFMLPVLFELGIYKLALVKTPNGLRLKMKSRDFHVSKQQK